VFLFCSYRFQKPGAESSVVVSDLFLRSERRRRPVGGSMSERIEGIVPVLFPDRGSLLHGDPAPLMFGGSGVETMNGRDEIEAERRRRAEAALAGVVRDGEVIGSSGFARTMKDAGRRLGDHFGAGDAEPDDRIEVWGRRLGRGLALIAALALLVHLVLTYGPGRGS
jgi:hypothetical protein